jgi:hypothetical protein
MIEALTPQLLSVALLLVIALSSGLTLVAAVAVLWLYRRSVLRVMAVTTPGIATDSLLAVGGAPPPAAATGVTDTGAELRFERALQAPWRTAMRNAAAGAVFVVVMSAAVGMAFPLVATPYRIALFAWGYMWPAVLALTLICPSSLSGFHQDRR